MKPAYTSAAIAQGKTPKRNTMLAVMEDNIEETASLSPPALLLASRSPRRRGILSQHGIRHEAVAPGFDDAELMPGPVAPEQWVASLAYLKAKRGEEIARETGGARFILGADTVCVKNGRILGTPTDSADAERILRELFPGTHDVLTGVAVLDRTTGRRHMFTDRATVITGVLAEDVLRAYIDSGDWSGKAGAYNLSERIEAGWPIRYSGDPTTIMGLPMGRLGPLLARLGVMEG